MISKQIGQSPEYNLMYEILRKLNRITQIAPNIGWLSSTQGDSDDGLWHDAAYFPSDDGLWHDDAYFLEDDGLWHDDAYF